MSKRLGSEKTNRLGHNFSSTSAIGTRVIFVARRFRAVLSVGREECSVKEAVGSEK